MAANPSLSDPAAFCDRILPDVSRSFALIIPQCPPPLDRAMCVAYLLCRIADTIEDEPDLPEPIRQTLYDRLLATVDSPADTDLARTFIAAWPAIPPDSYGELIRGTEYVVRTFGSLPAPLVGPIRTCVHDMVAGMRTCRPAETRDGVQFICRDLPDLDAYCHIVAGTVGVMSTALFEWRFAASGFIADDVWREQGRRMGLGLQMTNILKDCRVDAERGTSFIPSQYVETASGYRMTPAGRSTLVTHAVNHLDDAMAYIRRVPADETGVRTFLLGSVLPAIATLEITAADREYHPKISRDTMIEILNLVQSHADDDQATYAWYAQRRERTIAGLSS